MGNTDETAANRLFGEVLTQAGAEIWHETRKIRVSQFHQARPCPAGSAPQVLGGAGSCHDCESLLQDIVLGFTTKRISIGRRGTAGKAPAT